MTTPLERVRPLARVAANDAEYVLDLRAGSGMREPVVLRGPALAIWSLVDGTRTEAQIVDQLVETLGAEREVVARDTSDFLATLRGLGLLAAAAA